MSDLWEEFIALLPDANRQHLIENQHASGPILFRALVQAVQQRLAQEPKLRPVVAHGVALFSGECRNNECMNVGQPIHIRRALDLAWTLMEQNEVLCASCGLRYEFQAEPVKS